MISFLKSRFSLMTMSFVLLHSSIYTGEVAVEEVLKEFHVPGIAIGVVKDGKVIQSKGYGFRNLEEKEPVTADTIFPIASSTKAFTAMLVAQLVEEGHVNWDDLVVQHLPDFTLLDPEHASKITIRDLLAHRTGVPRHDIAWFPKNRSRDELYQCLRYLETQSPLREQFLYSNIMYMVAGKIVEAKLGISWEAAVQERIFRPLKMSQSSATMAEFHSCSDRAEPYASVDGMVQQVRKMHVFAVNPASGINSSINDMLKWVQAQLSGALVTKRQFEEMHTTHMAYPQKEPENGEHLSGVGFGWFIGTYQGEKLVRHGGLTAGYASEVTLLPEKGIGIVLLANSSTEGSQAMYALRNTILDQLLGLPEGNHMARYKAAATAQPPVTQKLPASLTGYLGMYEHPAYGLVEIFEQEGSLFCSHGNDTFTLLYAGNDTFVGRYMPLEVFGINPYVEFRFEKALLSIGFESFRGSKPALFQKIGE